MGVLSRYLLVRFSSGAIALFVVAIALVWLIQMLRLFDLVTAKGQNLLTLAGQAFLTAPPLSRQIIYICMGIGIARALAAMQDSRELHSIHTTRRTGAIWQALAAYAIGGAMIALLISNWAEPAAKRAANVWTAQIAADLIGQTLTPGRFTDVSDGVVLRIDGRDGNGIIEGFFADDSRDPDIRRTYLAERAELVVGNDGYQVSLRNGRLQLEPSDGRFSEIEFARYDLAISSLTEPVLVSDPLGERDTLTLISQARQAGQFTFTIVDQIHYRMAEGLRVVAICVLIAAIGAFPHGRRKQPLFPPELGVLILTFAERGISSLAARDTYLGHYAGPLILLGAASLVLAFQLGLPGALRRRLRGVPA